MLALQGWFLVFINLISSIIYSPDVSNISSTISDNGTTTINPILLTSLVPAFSEDDLNFAKPNYSTLVKTLLSLMYVGFSIAGMGGNALVVYAILTNPGLQIRNQLSNMTVLNLAIADFMTLATVSNPAIVAIFFEENPFGDVFCWLVGFLNLAFILTTYEALVVISLERLIAVKWSLHYPQIVTYQRMFYAQIWVWFNGIYVGIGWALLGVRYDYDTAVCDIAWDIHKPMRTHVFWWAVWGVWHHLVRPSIIIMGANTMIIQLSKDKRHAGGGDTGKSEEGKANAKILKAMVICIASFYTLLVPAALSRIFKIFGGPAHSKTVPPWINIMIVVFQFFSSCINPLIYGLFRKDFKDAYAKIWKNAKAHFGF